MKLKASMKMALIGVCTSLALSGCGLNKTSSDEGQKSKTVVESKDTSSGQKESNEGSTKSDSEKENKEISTKRNSEKENKTNLDENSKENKNYDKVSNSKAQSKTNKNKKISYERRKIQKVANEISNLDMGSAGGSLKKFVVFESLIKNADLLIVNEGLSKSIMKSTYKTSKTNTRQTVAFLKNTALLYLNNYPSFKKQAMEAGVNLRESEVSKAQLDKILEIIQTGVAYSTK